MAQPQRPSRLQRHSLREGLRRTIGLRYDPWRLDKSATTMDHSYNQQVLEDRLALEEVEEHSWAA